MVSRFGSRAPTLDELEVLGEFVVNSEHTFARTDAGREGEVWVWKDTTANILRVQIYSVALGKWTELGTLAPLVTTTVTGSLTLDSSDDVVLCDATSGAITVTLPAAASAAGMEYHVKKIDSSANAVTVDGDGSETIDGATTQVITTQWDSANVVSDGSAWFII